jgi:hypothetical protein
MLLDYYCNVLWCKRLNLNTLPMHNLPDDNANIAAQSLSGKRVALMSLKLEKTVTAQPLVKIREFKHIIRHEKPR